MGIRGYFKGVTGFQSLLPNPPRIDGERELLAAYKGDLYIRWWILKQFFLRRNMNTQMDLPDDSNVSSG